ncbi:MAG: acyl--CoA ligase [Myxococcales bacterium]|nr:acyl--CoA ligase [Myxococcales bacterium]
MSSSADPQRLMTAIEARLLAPGAPFEMAQIEVAGAPVRVFKNRPPHLRALLAGALAQAPSEAECMRFVGHDGERTYTYADLRDQVAAMARALSEEYAVTRGDRVAILAANGPEWVITFWATVSLGAVAVGLNGWWAGEEIVQGVAHADPKVLVADRKRLARVPDAAARLGVPVVVVEDDFEALLERHPASALPETPIDEQDPAVMLYTSGTTGRPRAAVHSHLNVTSAVGVSFFHGARTLAAKGMRPGDPDAPPNTILVTSPLFHVSGLHAAAVTSIAGGARTVWLTGRFDPALALDVIERERVTSWGYTATVLHRLVHDPSAKDHDLSAMRLLGGGGSPIAPPLQDAALALVPQCRDTMGVGYGLTEGCGFSTLIPGPELRAFPDSVGRPLPLVDVEIRDEAGAPVPDGTDGEIFVRGPMVMLEYFRDPEATAAAIGPERWLRTGDLGHLTDGRLYLATRLRDLILRGGENIYPQEIELRLEAHPDVAEAAVLGVPHEALGEEVKAVVVPRRGARPTPEALSAWVAGALAKHKVPAHWELRDAPLPRNATGKVLKRALEPDGTNPFIEE